MDLFASDVGGIASGNMRNRTQDTINAGIQQRNNEIANNIANLKSQEKTGEVATAVQSSLEGIMGARSLSSGISEYKAWKAKGAQKADQLQKLRSTAPEGLNGDVRVGDETEAPSVEVEAQATTEAPATPAPEGESATPSSNTNPTNEEHTAVTAGEDDAGGGGSLVNKGLQKVTGLTEEGVEKLGRGVGALGSIATAGMDLYKDFADHQWSKNSGWQDAGQVADFGAAIADTAAVVFPPAALVGGLLSGIGAITNDIGELFESKKEKAQQEQQQEQQKAQQEQVIQAPQAAQVAVARTA